MKNWKVILLAALVLMWIVDAKPWRDDSDKERTVATAGESRSKTEERQEQEQEATLQWLKRMQGMRRKRNLL